MKPILLSIHFFDIITHTIYLEHPLIYFFTINLEEFYNVFPVFASVKMFSYSAIFVVPSMFFGPIVESIIGFANVARVATWTSELVDDT